MKLPKTFATASALALLTLIQSSQISYAVDYNWIATDTRFWTGNSTQRADYYGTPTPGTSGPTSADNLNLAATGTLSLQNSGATLAGGLNRAINNLTSGVNAASIGSGATNADAGFTTLTVHGNLNLTTANTSLTFFNSGATPVTSAGMSATVLGNISITQSAALYLGVIGGTGVSASTSNYLLGLTANSSEIGKGQIQVDGTLMLNRRTTVLQLGDVNIGETGLITLTGAGIGETFDGTFDKTVQLRSLQGTGTLENSIVNTAGGSTSSTATLQINTVGATDSTFAGILRNGSGTNALLNVELNGPGRQVLTGANTYTGTTVINSGTLVVGVNGSGSLGNTAVTVNNGGTLAGSGAIAGTVTVATGGTLSPGNSPGTQEMGGLSLQSGGNYNWQIHDALGIAGVTEGWDLISVDGTLDLTNLTDTARFQINVWSLASVGPDVNGDAINFSAASNYQWSIITADVISYNNAFEFSELFEINTGAINGTSGFSNITNGSWFVSISGDNQSVVLNYQAIPEPSTGVLLLVGIGLGMVRRYLRKS